MPRSVWKGPFVDGYLCINDVTVRDLQAKDGQWTRAKGFDTFCPVGPRVVAGLDPRDLRITTRVNGVVRQDSRTSDLIFDVATLIAFESRHMTLEPGDLISTGTPAGVGNLEVGQLTELAGQLGASDLVATAGQWLSDRLLRS